MRLKEIVFFCSCLLFSLPPAAVAGEAEEEFSKGVAAAAAGDYRSALAHFLHAREQGLDRPSLDYNLGVAYFRLGQYDAAQEAYRRLAGNADFAPLAYYNLGLIANKTGDEDAAIGWFRRAYRASDDAKLQELASLALRRLGVEVGKARSRSRWSGFAGASLGYDSNVTLVNDTLSTVSGESDGIAEVLGVANYWLRGGRKDGVRVSLLADVQKYETLSDYDFSQFQLSLSRFGRLGIWDMQFSGSWNESFLGGNNYQRTLGAEARGRYALANDKSLQLRYRLNYINATDSLYTPLDGWRQQLRAALQVNRGAHRFQGYYQLDLNDRDDGLSGTRFTSYSPTRHTLRAIARLRLAARWQARLDARYRYSRYSDPSDLASGASVRREDEQLRVGGGLAHDFAKHWEVEAQYTYYDNHSNIEAYTYTRSVVNLGVNRYF